jgi:hypothetical protein
MGPGGGAREVSPQQRPEKTAWRDFLSRAGISTTELGHQSLQLRILVFFKCKIRWELQQP